MQYIIDKYYISLYQSAYQNKGEAYKCIPVEQFIDYYKLNERDAKLCKDYICFMGTQPIGFSPHDIKFYFKYEVESHMPVWF